MSLKEQSLKKFPRKHFLFAFLYLESDFTDSLPYGILLILFGILLSIIVFNHAPLIVLDYRCPQILPIFWKTTTLTDVEPTLFKMLL